MNRILKGVSTLVLVLALSLGVTAVALADEGAGSIVLTGAAGVVFTNDAAFSFEPKTLDGDAFSSTDEAGDSCVWALVDGRGTGVGWKIQVKSSDMTGLTDSTSTAITSTLTSSITPDYNQSGLKVQVEQADVTVMSGAEGSMPVSGLTYNVSTATFVTSEDLEVLRAAVDTGNGGYDIDPLFTIYLPAGVYAGTANLTLTVTQSDAP